MEPPASQRLLALDLMRGLDMLFLTVVGPLLWACHRLWGLPAWLERQLVHVPWEGLTAWDLIMPWFIFMCGAAIPFALPKRLEGGRAGFRFWRHVLGRVASLWLFGMVVQGNLLSLNWAHFAFYTNTLQAIAAGYLIAALALLLPRAWMRLALTLTLAGGYALLLATLGDYSPTGNCAIRVERWLFPRSSGDYTWCLTTMMFGAMTLCGMHCTDLLRSPRLEPWRKLLALALLGCGCLGGGLLLGLWEPAIKRIFTLSFTLQAMGWGILALGAFYFVADLLGVRRGWGLLTLYGRHALLAYLCMEGFRAPFDALAACLVQGIPHLLGSAYYPLFHTATVAFLLTVLLYHLDRHQRKA